MSVGLEIRLALLIEFLLSFQTHFAGRIRPLTQLVLTGEWPINPTFINEKLSLKPPMTLSSEVTSIDEKKDWDTNLSSSSFQSSPANFETISSNSSNDHPGIQSLHLLNPNSPRLIPLFLWLKEFPCQMLEFSGIKVPVLSPLFLCLQHRYDHHLSW
jgi:hypothetical protein